MQHLTILYRGPLASCDYDCPYCPFAKRRDTPEQLRADRAALERFTAWVAAQEHRVSVLFTPWGEGLVRSWYRRALTELSHLPHVERVAIQTNLSHRVAWTSDADPAKLALWATYHPGQVGYERFLGKCRELTERGVRHSVGIVGEPDHLDAAIDPLFSVSRYPHASRGLACRTGKTVVSVDGEGTVRRCHFVPAVLGNLYDGSFRDALAPRPCPKDMCDCHIGYVHLEPLGLYDTFAGGVLERIPALLGEM
jgi:MoaA/NifB/PqqE/SkfB family radical SAM enzyme